ncbi:amino acid adenylation domain-containing protein [Pseudomonas sp. LJDD11]|uniref:non-ribosomal peptide synthetase n=1 Tax=Pseudomonas sp. LJDD11 TaxID=2931984 RepID=UPI00211CF4D3|nr:non-ribosomal peptide synthetase [Pseudomonas sp. LJDD11]MCQ9424676.1 amino acid adenylation domain-containing protein [Pseudomonas sp. LJDD11]
MNAQDALKLARRFIELPQEKRRLFLEGLQQQGVDFALFPIPAEVLVDERDGLSYAQQRMWFLWQLDPQSAAYNLPMAVRLNGELDNAALQSAFDALVARHETLRSQFSEQDGVVRQRIVEPFAVSIACHDLSALATDAREEQVRTLADAEALAPFDLAHGPLLRVQLLKLADQEHVLLLTLHHIVADGWSYNVLIDEFIRLYDAASSGSDAALQPLPIQYRDYALWQRSWLEAGEQDRQLDYWRAKLGDDHAPLELPIDHSRPVTPSYRGARHEFQVEPALAERLRGLAREQGVTLFMVLLAAFKVLLHRYSGQQAIRVGVPVANRNRAEVEGLIGCFINTQVLHTEIDPLIDVRELLQRVKETALGAQGHQELPFERLVEVFEPQRSLGRNPLFQVLFNHQPTVVDAGQISTRSGLSLEKVKLDKHSARLDLSLDTYESAGHLHAAFTYALDLFDGATVAAMQQHWLQVLEGLATSPQSAVGELPLTLPELAFAAETAELAGQCIHQLIEQSAAAQPQRIAAVSGEQQIDYQSLNERANAVAQVLLEHGVQTDQRVGVIADRSTDMLVGILAVLKAGAAYLPLEPEQPRERLDFMLLDSDVRLVLTAADWSGELPEAVRRIELDAKLRAASAPVVQVAPANLAYVIYTSGTTGLPKGVGISHAALVNYVQGVSRRLPMDEIVNLAMVTTPAADLGHTVFYGALCYGKTLHLLGKDTVLDAEAFAAYMSRHAIDALKIVPSHLQAMLAAGAAALPRRCLVVGGESCSAGLLERIAALTPGLRILNHYGPTETAVGVLTHDMSDKPLLGRPLANIRALVLSDCLQGAPGSARGELYLSGAGLARGYLGRPALTAERFVPDPAAADGTRMYRTGDWVRRNAQGELLFAGRMDGQVKIRGYRVELAEIESQLRQLPGISNAVVRVIGDDSARQLAAWLVPSVPVADEAARQVFLDEIRRELKQSLPEHMQPTHMLALEQLPVTANGKVDIKALPEPVAHVASYVAPVTALQVQLAEIWAQVLQVEQVGLTDNFFALGGHSLLATQVVSRARKQLNVDIPLRALFDTSDLQAFAASVQRLGSAGDTGIERLDRSAPLAVSHAQYRQWMFWKLNPQSTAYNTPLAVKLQGELNRPALQAAFDALVARHESLRTVFEEHDGQPLQRILPVAAVPVAFEDLAGQAADAVTHKLAEQVSTVFDLERGPLIRVTLFKTAENEHLLSLMLHHIVSDGWSMSVMVRELAATYNAHAAGQPLEPQPLPVQYADYAAWQRKLLAGGQLQSQLAYWKDNLEDDFSVLQLPTDHPRPQEQSYRGGRIDIHLPAELTDNLRALAVSANATLFHVFLSSFAILLSRYSGSEKINIGIPVTNRNRLELEGLIGFFVNTIIARVAVDPVQTFDSLLASVKETTLQAQANKDIPFDALVEELKPERTLGYNPLFQVMYNHLRDFGERVSSDSVSSLRAEEVDWVEQTAQFDLSLDTLERSDGVMASFGYASDLFDAQRIERLAGHWIELLKGVAQTAQGPVAELPMLDDVERTRISEGWNPARSGCQAEPSMLSLLQAQARARPDAVALVLEDRTLSYAQLNSQANRLAYKLREMGVGPEVRVGIAVERSFEMVIGLLGILKAGGAYVPLDPEYPQDRLSYMLEDSGIRVLLTQAWLKDKLAVSPAITLLELTQDEHALADYSDHDPVAEVLPENLAYVIYTSGSTGRPKGVAIAHAQLSAFCSVAREYSRLSSSDRVLQFATVSFDGFVEQLYPALSCGAQVVLRGQSLWSIDTLKQQIDRHGVTLADLPTAYWRLLAADGVEPGTCTSLRQVHVGGEAMPPEGLRDWLASNLKQARLVNTYGPTEATVVSTVFDCSTLGAADIPQANMPIGSAIGGRTTYICDSGLSIAPAGCISELLIGGSGCLARGYFNRPALTAERFIPDPFDTAEQGGGRLYRTGDLARYLDDGVIEYAGRIDHQVKIRGFRIELGEIEARLQALDAVRDAVVLVNDGAGSKQLVAYVVAAQDNALASPESEALLRDTLRALLKASLPDYMVPAWFVMLATLPLTLNGKLDRKALPAPDVNQLRLNYVAAQSELEQQVADIWAQVLKLDRVGLTDNFFELGGHSLLATQVISRVRQVLNIELPLRTLFEAAELAAFVARVEEGAAGRVLNFEHVDRHQPISLSYAQQRQWFLWQLEPDSAAYNMPTALRLRGRLDHTALKRSFDALIARHETLRTTFQEAGEQAVQIIHAPQPVDIAYESLNHEDLIESSVEQEIRQPFDLLNGPLLRVKLLRLEEDDHVLVLTMHHIVSDGWSMPVMVDELVTLYQGYEQGDEVSLPPLPIQYADYAVWQRRWMEAGEQQRQMAYWTGQLGGEQPVLELPLDHPRPAIQSHAGARLELELSSELSASLKQLAQRHGVTLFMVLLASFQTLLHRYSGQADIRVGVPNANRNRVETERLLGFFVNTQVLKAEFDQQTTFSELLQQVKLTALAAQAHQDLPFEQLVEALQPERSLSRSPLFNVMFNHLSLRDTDLRSLSALDVEHVSMPGRVAKFDLSLDTFEAQGRLSAALTYATSLFEHATIGRLSEHWQNLLASICDQPQQRVAELAMLAAPEQQAILQRWGLSRPASTGTRHVHQTIAEWVKRTPQAVAVVCGEQQLTYGQLDEQANRLAHRLVELGVGPEVRVAVAMHRSVEIVVAFLAVLKAGGAYVPLDVAYPQDRLLYMMNDCAATLLLTQSDLLARLPVPRQVVTLAIDEPDNWQHCPATAVQSQVAQGNLAYVIYTSGSTGQPKGVAVAHGPIAMHCQAIGERYEMTPADCELQFMSLAFDGAHERWLTALTHGARLLLRGDDLWTPEQTYQVMHRHGVSVTALPPVYMQQLAEHAERDGHPPAVRIYCFGGDAVPQASYELAWKTLRPQYLFNGYGPTETVVTPLLWKARQGDVCDAAYAPIGTLLGNRCGYVLDAALNLQPVGLPGELYLGGEGVARGYLGRAALTAERFVPDPFDPLGGGRVYRSGDLTRTRPDGVVDYLGRVDLQVKVRGFRIELGEIEAQLLQMQVREAVVLVQGGDEGKHLVAWLVPADDSVLEDLAAQAALRTAMRASLKASLPDYMVPSFLVFLDTLPLTPNGKLDRKALPEPDTRQLQQVYVAPVTELEQQVASVWAQVLKIEQAGLTDNFFELGGHSLLATQVMLRLREQFGISMALRDLFDNPQLDDFCRAAGQKDNQDAPIQDELAKSLEALKRLTAEEIDELIS